MMDSITKKGRAKTILKTVLGTFLPRASGIIDSIVGDPKQRAALKGELNKMMHERQLAELAAESNLSGLIAQDRADARAMKVQTGSRLTDYFGIGIFVSFVALLLVLHLTPASGDSMLQQAIMYFAGLVGSVVGFYFGEGIRNRRRDFISDEERRIGLVQKQNEK